MVCPSDGRRGPKEIQLVRAHKQGTEPPRHIAGLNCLLYLVQHESYSESVIRAVAIAYRRTWYRPTSSFYINGSTLNAQVLWTSSFFFPRQKLTRMAILRFHFYIFLVEA